MKPIQMIDLASHYLRIKDEIDSSISKVVQSGSYINGSYVDFFAKQLAQYLSVNHVIPCANGTDALQISLMALDLKPGDEIITSNFSFIAAAEAIALLSLKPIFVDIHPQKFTIETKAIEQAITPRTKAIIPVHLFGQACNMQAIKDIASKHNLIIIEDVAQSFGGECIIDGVNKKLGTIGDIGCTSFFPSKNLACFGDGGAIFTNNDELARKMKLICNHGATSKFIHETIGLNSRLDTIQAAILSVKLNYLDNWNKQRIAIANQYDSLLSTCSQIILPVREINSTHVFNQYTIILKVGLNTDLQKYLAQNNIPSNIYYPLPLNKQEVFANLNSFEKSFSVSQSLSQKVLSLPIHTELEREQIEYITITILNYFA